MGGATAEGGVREVGGREGQVEGPPGLHFSAQLKRFFHLRVAQSPQQDIAQLDPESVPGRKGAICPRDNAQRVKSAIPIGNCLAHPPPEAQVERAAPRRSFATTVAAHRFSYDKVVRLAQRHVLADVV